MKPSIYRIQAHGFTSSSPFGPPLFRFHLIFISDLVPRSRMVELYLHNLILLLGLVINWLTTEITQPFYLFLCQVSQIVFTSNIFRVWAIMCESLIVPCVLHNLRNLFPCCDQSCSIWRRVQIIQILLTLFQSSSCYFLLWTTCLQCVLYYMA
jgi:hypothetical protein